MRLLGTIGGASLGGNVAAFGILAVAATSIELLFTAFLEKRIQSSAAKYLLKHSFTLLAVTGVALLIGSSPIVPICTFLVFIAKDVIKVIYSKSKQSSEVNDFLFDYPLGTPSEKIVFLTKKEKNEQESNSGLTFVSRCVDENSSNYNKLYASYREEFSCTDRIHYLNCGFVLDDSQHYNEHSLFVELRKGEEFHLAITTKIKEIVYTFQTQQEHTTFYLNFEKYISQIRCVSGIFISHSSQKDSTDINNQKNFSPLTRKSIDKEVVFKKISV